MSTNGNLTIQDSTVSGNAATGTGKGGAVYFYSGGGLLVSGSTISGNTAGSTNTTYSGGGVSYYGTVTAFGRNFVNSTIANNTAAGSGGGIGVAATFTGTLNVIGCTVTGNTATGGFGGGISVANTSATALNLANTVVALNTNATNPDIFTGATGGAMTANNSFIGDNTGLTITGSGNLTGNPMLGPLQNNGGTTLTRAPLAGSPLLNAGGNTYIPTGVTTDQRGSGFVRAFGSATDIGAVEIQPPPTTVVSIVRAGTTPTGGTTVSWTVTLAASVTGLSASNFALVTTGGVTGAGGISVSGSGTTYTVTANTGTGEGTIGLNLVNSTGLSPGVTGLPFVGQTYTIDKTAPTVTSINRVTASPSNLTQVQYTVTFGEAVNGVDAADFSLAWWARRSRR